MSFFWNGYHLRDFLFKHFNTGTIPGFLGICVALFSAGILYEAMYYLKKGLLQKFLKVRKYFCQEQRRRSVGVEPTVGIETDDAGEMNPRNSLLANSPSIEEEPRRISGGYKNFEFFYLLLASVIHGCYAFVGYTLMNAVMTFNVWVLVSVCMGIGIGYLFFQPASRGSDISGDTSSFQTKCSIETESEHTDQLLEDNENPFRSEDGLVTDQDNRKTDSKDKGSRSTRTSPTPSGSRPRLPITDDSSPVPAPQVIVVGAQVHNHYEQSA